MERTLILLKPDAIQKALIGEIISRFENKGFKIIGLKMIKISAELSKEHYSHLVSKPFYADLEKFITHHPVVAMVLEGNECVEVVRAMMGPTNSRKAAPGTIRGDLSLSTSRNIIHGSDSKETAENEIKRFFKPEELFEYKSCHMDYDYAPDE
ncbi:nucleoside-diphosphate kinase [Candidatus Micrarchaeota archaeon]|nr:nucleoside-diphosphate kinase [Candidatus Micrarchaeota archaeon]